MNLHQLLVEQEIKKGNMLLESITQDMEHDQRYIVENIYNELRPLIEASLTTDQIGQLFQGVEQQVVAAGGNRTLLGKAKDAGAAGVDAVKKANEIINNAGKWLQNTKPVQNFDAKFEKLKNDINKKFPDSKLLDGISKMGLWAQENPGKTAAIVGILTAIASLAGGPVGGAIAGQVLRGSVELLKGEKLSTAIGKGIKTAALGYLSGKAFELLGDAFAGLRAQVIDQGQFSRVSFDVSKSGQIGSGNNFHRWTQQLRDVNLKLLPDDADNVNFLVDQIRKGGENGVKAFDKLAVLAAEYRSKDYIDMLKDIGQSARDNDSLYQWIQGGKNVLQSVSQGAIAGAAVKSDSKESIDRVTIKAIFEMVDLKQSRLDEGPMDWLRQKGKNLTNKVTADKLMSAWKSAGSPTDSNEVAKIIKDAGVDDAIVNNVFKSMKIKLTPAKETPKTPEPGALTVDDIVGAIAKMRSRDLLSLQKTVDGLLGTQSAAATEPATGGAGAFGQMANTLSPANKTSAGGTVTQTKTGLKHKSAPGNPNAPANSPAAKPKVVRGGRAKAA